METAESVKTYTIRAYLGGDIHAAKDVIRQHCYADGLCVTIEPTTFIYTGGEEDGFVVGFVNYPRFPSTKEELLSRARKMVADLLPRLNQRSALLVCPDISEWISVKPPGAPRDLGSK